MENYKDAIRYYKKFLELKQFSEDAIFSRNRINELRAEYFSKDNSLTLFEQFTLYRPYGLCEKSKFNPWIDVIHALI